MVQPLPLETRFCSPVSPVTPVTVMILLSSDSEYCLSLGRGHLPEPHLS